jgi:hypothetical protein
VREREALGGRDPDANPRERAGAEADGEQLHVADPEAREREHPIDVRQQGLAVLVHHARLHGGAHGPVLEQRDGTDLRARVDRENAHGRAIAHGRAMPCRLGHAAGLFARSERRG